VDVDSKGRDLALDDLGSITNGRTRSPSSIGGIQFVESLIASLKQADEQFLDFSLKACICENTIVFPKEGQATCNARFLRYPSWSKNSTLM
jgi:hypothetical protein